MHDRLIVERVHSKHDIERPLAERQQLVKRDRVAQGATAGGGRRGTAEGVTSFAVSHRKQGLGIEVRDKRPVRCICGVCRHNQWCKTRGETIGRTKEVHFLA